MPKHVLYKIQEGVYKNGVYDTILLKQAKDNGDDLWTMGTFIETPEADVEKYWNKATDGTSRHGTNSIKKFEAMPDWLLNHFRHHFSNVPGLVDLMECLQKFGEVSPHPQYEFGRIERVHKGRVVILGDAAHMASPRTAVGAHTAILDSLALMEAFETEPNDIDAALELYSQTGLRNAHALFARTRQVSSEFISGLTQGSDMR
jgi:2-polyprenyl-6-methoxyphenol hydroxylase-like FAD-dependent oxidoreductase